MSLSVLSVAYPLAPVTPATSGGAEQILRALDRGLVRRGHRSVVIAMEGSAVCGELIPTPRLDGTLDDQARSRAWEAHSSAIAQALRHRRFDVVHMHGVDFHHYLPSAGPPVLATLHLPPEWYPPEVFQEGKLKQAAPRLQCVSRSQQMRCPPSLRLAPYIENGVPLEELRTAIGRRGFALMLGRICPEKGTHVALDAAMEAGCPLLIAGEVFRYAAHEEYFQNHVLPRLDGRRLRFLGPAGPARKRRLLAAARCVLIPSLAPETSSLVAMEAAACGTPVIAFRTGALPEIVEDGRTGFIVEDTSAMAEAIREASRIDPEVCRETARRRFSAERMVEDYLRLYMRLARVEVGSHFAA